ncbi:hypothetical protein CBM2585_B130070 [Cupriavidus taiwanensis]|nr:hypothetical protein CBM2585_B130070 [Cupriavidus taiwanensis]
MPGRLGGSSRWRWRRWRGCIAERCSQYHHPTHTRPSPACGRGEQTGSPAKSKRVFNANP